MLITKEVEVEIVAANAIYYNKLGYEVPKKYNNKNKLVYNLGSKLLIKIEHLPLGSHYQIHAKCDFCGKDIYDTYYNYNRTIKKYGKDNLDSCIDCKGKKTNAMQSIRNENNLNNVDDKGYWCDINNVIKEFNDYYNENGTFLNLHRTKYGQSIKNAIFKHNETTSSLALRLGYSIQDLGRVPNGWYDDFEVFKEDIIKVINKLHRFPTILEIERELRVGYVLIQKHGGIQEIKKKIPYNQDTHLLDDNGYYNASSFEYMLAQYLIHNTNIYYERNTLISPEDGKFNSDFRFKPVNKDYIWVEIWGGVGNNKFYGMYDKTHKIKMDIYKKKKFNLISFYPEDFNKSYEDIQKMFYEVLKPYINLNYIKIDNSIISYYKYKSDADILNELMEYSDDNYYLPNDTIIKNSNSRLYKEIYKRYGNFGKMAIKFGITDRLKHKSHIILEYIKTQQSA